MISRGRADVKYQCHGLVPQPEAPRLSSLGKTFDRKAASSGQRSLRDCQKNVSIETVNSRPAIVAVKIAGINTLRISLIMEALFRPVRTSIQRH